MKLHTENFGGNLHATAVAINKRGWAEYVVVLQSNPSGTVAVFRMPDDMVHDIRRLTPSYQDDVHHDDYSATDLPAFLQRQAT